LARLTQRPKQGANLGRGLAAQDGVHLLEQPRARSSVRAQQVHMGSPSRLCRSVAAVGI
jgi:hypothetical protein